MGVPKFYRWISERYPCLSEVVKEYQIPEFDNLYLDMNGIIHVCSHPEDDNPHFRITEEKIFESIFHYIEVLFRMIKPRKVFFMAVDGVAPRAKMNQQRGRRFRSAREAEDLVKKALEKGEVLPTEARFDSNCITPGTEFMDKLQDQLKYFVVKKASTDRLWQGVRVYLSGHETPGEGEHKVMDFIRHEKSRPDFDSNTRHCLYGLDADLMMLGLTSHEPHFSLLREEVRFGKQNQKRSSTVEETTFHLLHLSLMREYIDFEFSSLKDKLSFPYDLERIIDDWVLMGFLVGNDFIPHLPDLHIHHNALPMLWKTYKKVLPTLPGYLNDGGTLNLPNFEAFMRRLSKFDVDNFREKHADLQWFNNRRREKMDDMPDALSSEQAGIPTANEFMSLRDDASGDEDETFQTTLQSDMEAMAQELDFYEDEEREEEEEYEEDDSQFYVEFQKFKAGYYRDKLEYPKVTEAVIHEQCFEYVKAIQWILHYYFNGVQSWSWFYPFHYAPYLSDIRSFSDFKLPYDRSYPFFPFQQLMAVLPSASKNLIPLPLQSLMLDETSPVKDFYPEEFSTDLNGKQQEWEAVVQIPFIDEKRLLSAMKPLEAKMTDEEKARNKHGPHTLFVYSATPQGTYTSTVFPDLYNHHAVITDVPMEEFWLAPRCIKKGLMDGVKQDVYFPGFPTLKHLPHTAKLMKSGVKVFQHASKGENMVLHLENSSDCDHEDMAQQLIGKSVYVAWPHLMEARVNAISDDETRFYGVELHSPKSKSHKMTIQSEDLEPDQAKVWRREVESIRESYMSRKAVDIGQTYLLVYASLLSGRRYICGSQGKVTLDKQYSNTSQPFVLQGTVRDIAVKDPSYREYSTLEDLFSEKSEVFMLGNPHYGAMGEVLSVDSKNDGRVRVDFTIQTEPSLAQVAQHGASLAMQYFPGYSQARRLGITPYVMSRITGSVFINRGSKEKTTHDRHNRVNVGLNLKFNKSGNEVPGYTKKLNDEWLYSNKLQQVLGQYLAEYPQMFEFIARNNDESSYYEANIFKNSEHTLADVAAFLKKLPTASVQPVPFGSNVLDENIVEKIQEEVTKVKEINRKKKKHIKMQVRPHLLFRPLEAQLTLTPDPSTTWELFDRIVNVRDGFSVPLGLRGTLIGVTNAEKEQDVLYDVVFDEEFLGGLTIRCSPNCAYRMPKTAMVNISHGERKTQGKSPVKPTAVVKPQASAWGGPIGTYDFYAENSPGQRGGRHKGGNHGNNDRGYSNKDGNHGNRQQGGHNRQLNFGGAQQDSNRQAEGNRGNRQTEGNRGNIQAEGNRGNRQQTWQQAQQSQQGSQPQNQGGRNMRGQNRGNQGNQRGPHGNQGGGFQDNMTGPDDNQGEFAEMWRQLQTSYAPPPPGTQPPAQLPPGMLPNQPNVPPQAQQPTQAAGANSQPRHGKSGRQDKHKAPQAPAQGQGPSLQDAAIALQVAQIEDNQHAEDRRGQKIDLGQLFNTNVQFEPSKNSKKQKKKAPAEPDAFSSQTEFSAIFNALQLGDKPAEVPEPPPATMGVRYLQESTAALCQMLKITPGDGNQGAASNHGNSNQGAASNHGNSNQGGASNHGNSNQGGGPPAYGKQLSVQDLFGDGKDATPQSKGQGQEQPPKDANKPS